MSSSVPTAWGNLLLKDNVPMLIRWSVPLPIRHSANSTDKHSLSYGSFRNASSTWEAALLPFWATFQYSCYSSVSSAVLEMLTASPLPTPWYWAPASLQQCAASPPNAAKCLALSRKNMWSCRAWAAKRVCADPWMGIRLIYSRDSRVCSGQKGDTILWQAENLSCAQSPKSFQAALVVTCIFVLSNTKALKNPKQATPKRQNNTTTDGGRSTIVDCISFKAMNFPAHLIQK